MLFCYFFDNRYPKGYEKHLYYDFDFQPLLMISDVDHLGSCLLFILHIVFWRKAKSLAHFWTGFLSYCWICRISTYSGVIIPFQIWDLQNILSHSLLPLASNPRNDSNFLNSHYTLGSASPPWHLLIRISRRKVSAILNVNKNLFKNCCLVLLEERQILELT